MGKWVHRLDAIDLENNLGHCTNCGIVKLKIKKNKIYCGMGQAKWNPISENKEIQKLYVYRQFKKDKCFYCGFIPLDKSQLDVDHIDGNHNNNDEINLQTLCANCHRLKTHKPELML